MPMLRTLGAPKIIFLLLEFVILHTTAFSEVTDVLKFTDHDFETRIVDYGTALVFFYAPWCSHCTDLMPEIEKAATVLIRNNPPVALIAVNCIESGKETCDQHSVTAYPTLKIFFSGKYYKKYNEPRNSESIIKYMKSQVKPNLKKLHTNTDLNSFLNTIEETVFVGVFQNASDLYYSFLETAEIPELKYQFVLSLNQQVLDQQELKDDVILFRPLHLTNKFEPRGLAYQGSANSSQLKDFIVKNYYGLVGIRTTKNKNAYRRPLVVVYFDIDYKFNPKRTNYWRNRILPIARYFEEDVTFAISSSKEFSKELEVADITLVDPNNPVAIATNIAEKNFVFNEEFTVEAFKTFVVHFLNEKLNFFIRSEPIPVTKEGLLIVAVGKTFKEVIFNAEKDTFVMLYDPESDSYKKLLTDFEELSRSLGGEYIDVVKINAVDNDIPLPYRFDGPVTIYWALRENKDIPEKYDGEFSVNGFIKFIAQKATDELSGWDRSGNPKEEYDDFFYYLLYFM